MLLLAGSAIDLSAAQERADAVLLGWYPGAGGGRAVAELLFGAVSPSGKLPVTFYRNEALAELPAFTDYSLTGRTYRYYQGEPLRTLARVTVRNGGARDTEEVLQLYLRDEASPFAPPNPVLCGFRRVFLAAGEEKSLSVPLGEQAFTVVNDAGEHVPGSGRWTLYAGFGGPDARTEALTGRKALSVPIRSTP